MSEQKLWLPPARREDLSPAVQSLLKDIQDTMGLPWVPLSWLSYVTYPELATLLWGEIKPVAESRAFSSRALHLTEHTYDDANQWYLPARNLQPVSLDQQAIGRELDAFEFGNGQLLLQHAMLARALSATPAWARGSSSGGPRQERSLYCNPEIRMVDQDAAPGGVKVVFDEIREMLEAPAISPDFRALAKWPQFFGAAWEDIRLWVRRDPYVHLAEALTEMAARAAGELPGLRGLDGEELTRAAGGTEPLRRFRSTVDLYSDMLPRVIVTDAMFRLAAAGGWRAVAPGLGWSAA